MLKHGKSSAFKQVDSEVESNLEPASLFWKSSVFVATLSCVPSKIWSKPLKKTGSDRGNSKNHLACASINWLSWSATIAEIGKYVCHDDELQEDQLEFLMNKFTLQDLKQAYLITLGKARVDYASVMLRKNVVMSLFTSLIYDHRSMMYEDSEDAFR